MTKRNISPVKNEKVVLRLLEEADLPLTLSWRNQDNVRNWFLTTEIIPLEKHIEWFTRYKNLDNDFVFVILSQELNMQPVGQISLYAISWENRIGEYGRLMIGEEQARGKGFAKSASSLLLDIGFRNFGLEQILLEVKADNFSAISLYQSLGFVEVSQTNELIRMNKHRQIV